MGSGRAPPCDSATTSPSSSPLSPKSCLDGVEDDDGFTIFSLSCLPLQVTDWYAAALHWRRFMGLLSLHRRQHMGADGSACAAWSSGSCMNQRCDVRRSTIAWTFLGCVAKHKAVFWHGGLMVVCGVRFFMFVFFLQNIIC